ncbi:N-acetylmuramoyl-L-alanine amidase [Caldalkalibacillus uzonensis]|uniref:N-acetylmuramoyl-L-alanine amidase n=1 Tax=Caldalkalibacillus uzonensis TaxID=353224 RepID=A0ABU0CVK0_9BACI|nr:cell wall hydrolase [Caldalkalibacillus uzonensis]MDQ0340449.1 N-acetylmuramoyl-L-alanine amidase [Caldalkalibacillus uzonensis]
MRRTLLILTVLAVILVVPGLASAYTIKPGDTLSELAQKLGLGVDDILKLNPEIKDPDLIYAGDSLNLPDGESEAKQTKKSGNKSHNITAKEKDLLARIVHAEAKGEPFAGKVAVAHVVLNRVEHDAFPDTITEVIFQPRQFQPVANGAINQSPDTESVRAVEEALKTRGSSKGSLYFYNPQTATNSWVFSRETVKVIGNHVFAR